MIFLTPNKLDGRLLGARYAHFEGFLHLGNLMSRDKMIGNCFSNLRKVTSNTKIQDCQAFFFCNSFFSAIQTLEKD